MRNVGPVLLRRDGWITDLLLPPGQGVTSIAASDADRSRTDIQVDTVDRRTIA